MASVMAVFQLADSALAMQEFMAMWYMNVVPTLNDFFFFFQFNTQEAEI
jgi:hypothetical protein